MLFLQRQTSLDFDDMLASISGGFAGGTAFGLFENSEEMALLSVYLKTLKKWHLT